MSDVLRNTFLIGVGAIGWFVTERTLVHDPDQHLCPSMLSVSDLVDGCLRGSRETCELMDRTVPASCLMERAIQATAAKRMRFNAGQPKEVTL